MDLYEQTALDVLTLLSQLNPGAFSLVSEYVWLFDDVNRDEVEALMALLALVDKFQQGDPLVAGALGGAGWLSDGILREEVSFLEGLTRMSSAEPLALAEALSDPTLVKIPSSTLSPRPSLGPLVSISDLTWTKDGLTEVEQKALTDLQTFERDFPEMAEFILSYPWVADGITDDEQLALNHILVITQGGPLAKLFDTPLPDSEYRKIVDRMPGHYYLMDGITAGERQFLVQVAELPDMATMVANFIAGDPNEGDHAAAKPAPAPTPTPASDSSTVNFPWAQDGLTAIEQEAIGYLQDLQRRDEYVAGEVMQAPWLPDGVDEGERRLLCLIASNPETSTGLAIFLTTSPSTTLPACP